MCAHMGFILSPQEIQMENIKFRKWTTFDNKADLILNLNILPLFLLTHSTSSSSISSSAAAAAIFPYLITE